MKRHFWMLLACLALPSLTWGQALGAAAAAFDGTSKSMMGPPGPMMMGDDMPMMGTDQSDLWWNSAESGWGMQLNKQNGFMFATLFIYGPDGKPTWATAQMQANGPLAWSGMLYLSDGPWFGGMFNPSAVTTRLAGTMTFQALTDQSATVTYTIDNVTVTRQVSRIALGMDNYTGNFTVAARIETSGCTNLASNGVIAGAMRVDVSHSGNAMTMSWTLPDSTVCSYTGTYDQSGHMGGMTASYSCTNGDVGQMRLFELIKRPGMISGRMRGASTMNGCQYSGYLSGADLTNSPQ
jgi:hypothetical protein